MLKRTEPVLDRDTVVVPRYATRAMESAGAPHAFGGTATHAALCWEAMINAALEED